jgi:hypothetical protein
MNKIDYPVKQNTDASVEPEISIPTNPDKNLDHAKTNKAVNETEIGDQAHIAKLIENGLWHYRMK